MSADPYNDFVGRLKRDYFLLPIKWIAALVAALGIVGIGGYFKFMSDVYKKAQAAVSEGVAKQATDTILGYKSTAETAAANIPKVEKGLIENEAIKTALNELETNQKKVKESATYINNTKDDLRAGVLETLEKIRPDAIKELSQYAKAVKELEEKLVSLQNNSATQQQFADLNKQTGEFATKQQLIEVDKKLVQFATMQQLQAAQAAIDSRLAKDTKFFLHKIEAIGGNKPVVEHIEFPEKVDMVYVQYIETGIDRLLGFHLEKKGDGKEWDAVFTFNKELNSTPFGFRASIIGVSNLRNEP